MSLGDDVITLLHEQQQEWPALASGLAALKEIRTREIALEDFSLRLQFNPRRIVSSGAKVDAKSIAERKCFLCAANRPREQRGIALGDGHTLLLNPFPILPVHLTVPTDAHTMQAISSDRVGAMLRLARSLGERFVVFYNGPRAGASAPDHMHFQVGNTRFLPIETQYESLRERFGKELVREGGATTLSILEPARPFVAIEGSDAASVANAFHRLVQALPLSQGDAEPSMNLFAWWLADAWRVIVFPRRAHRPAVYFAEGDAKILLSPGAVDVAGVIVLPVERDFDRVTRADLEQMFREVMWDAERIASLRL
jgi:ATP adenylyltransferase/5',5'''-P-1,P-4-tetraphosphate phosphorylase II